MYNTESGYMPETNICRFSQVFKKIKYVVNCFILFFSYQGETNRNIEQQKKTQNKLWQEPREHPSPASHDTNTSQPLKGAGAVSLSEPDWNPLALSRITKNDIKITGPVHRHPSMPTSILKRSQSALRSLLSNKAPH